MEYYNMEIKRLAKKLLSLDMKIDILEKAILHCLCSKMQLELSKSTYISDYFDGLDTNAITQVLELANKWSFTFDLYNTIELFELLLPSEDSKENGMVYTPTSIKKYIIEEIITDDIPQTVCDPACGCGSFLLSAAEYFHVKYGLTFKKIFTEYVFGADIVKHNIDKCTTFFHILALMHDEVVDNNFNLIITNSLGYSWDKKFKYIIGNPPYVRAKNIPEGVKKSLAFWETSKTGNIDLYIPFYELGCSLLQENGKLGFISPNTYLQSVNGRGIRAYFKSHSFHISILDFRETQVFKNVTSYTCITIVDKEKKYGTINYALLNGKSSLNDYQFTSYLYDSFQTKDPWRLGSSILDEKIMKIERFDLKLDSFRIRNGLATLKNNAFFFKPVYEDDSYYHREYEGKIYKIEKDICINVAKPNIIKTENELLEKLEKAIFPYSFADDKATLIDEETIIAQYPYCYEFLLSIKENLLARDKGCGKYPNWYAYGRTQGMMNKGKKLLIPYISGNPVAVLSLDVNLLFYCGYAVFSEDEKELRILKRFLESSVFWFYISHTSKPYAKGYMSFAKNYIKNFSIPLLSESEETELLSLKSKKSIDKFIENLYGIDI